MMRSMVEKKVRRQQGSKLSGFFFNEVDDLINGIPEDITLKLEKAKKEIYVTTDGLGIAYLDKNNELIYTKISELYNCLVINHKTDLLHKTPLLFN